jgi:hypothetical protein
MDLRTRVVVIAFGSLFSVYDVVFKLRYISAAWIAWGAFVGLGVGVICSLLLSRLVKVKDELVLPEDGPPFYHFWLIGLVGGGYIGYNSHVGLHALDVPRDLSLVLVSLFSFFSILSLVLCVVIDNSIKARRRFERYLLSADTTWTPLTLALSLLTAVSFGQIGGFLCTAFCVSLLLGGIYIAYAVKMFGVLSVIGAALLVGIGWALYLSIKRRRRIAYTHRLLEEIEARTFLTS